MMRILQAMAGAPHGGAERFFERLVPALQRAGVDQRVLIRRDEARAGRLRDAGIADLVQLGYGGRFDLATPRQVKRQIGDFRPDILFTWMNRASQNAPVSPVKGHAFRRVARLGGYYDLKYYRGCDYLIGDTQSIVDYLTGAGWPVGKAVYLPNFVAATPGRRLSRQAFSLPESGPLLLALGRLHVNKAFDTLLLALARVPEASLLLAGEGPERPALEALAVRLGLTPRVRFLGWRDDIPDLFASADLFVHSARHEPLGNVIIEAWAQRLPVVCTASQGPAVLVEDGVSGFLAPVDQPEQLAVALRRALGDPAAAAAAAAAGRAVYDRDYTEAAVVGKYLAFFQRILG